LFSVCSVDSIGNSAIESEVWKDVPAHSEDAFSIVSAVDADLVSRGLVFVTPGHCVIFFQQNIIWADF
jgi:hypothetical protein